MRIVSQDKRYDLPYDKFVIWCEDNIIQASPLIDVGNRNDWGVEHTLLGRYSDEDIALKVMETIRKNKEACNNGIINNYYFYMPQDE